MLHIINKSPFDTNALDTCLRMAQAGHAVLLIEDGVYAATQGSAMTERMRQAATKVSLFVLQPDLDARGMTAKLQDGITPVDYTGFVDLVEQYPTSQSWL
ncbi:sulfurtransferase complex subunit TusB [Rhodoferax sp.]|uniref:sulfurtransferase complex subunit TusB n=1 Tax=Rhodoferax sp. TaxID=50421 RepID=UPI0019FE84D0|nr:sulfurtransferase complex subunit TusB [Rhodoferax sp.]MBE0472609.1 sulfurtransferase complex subunit TusB [Rhodoferax sp.]